MEGPVQGQTLTQIVPHVPDPKANFLPHVPISRKKIIRKGFAVELSSMQYTHPSASQRLALSSPDPQTCLSPLYRTAQGSGSQPS